MGYDRRRTGLTTACCGLLTLGTLAAPAAFAQTDTSGKVVTLDVSNADFSTVVRLLDRESGVDVTVRSGDRPFGLVTVHLVDAPLDKAMHRIAFSAHAHVTQDADGSYTFEPEAAPVEQRAEAAPSAPAQSAQYQTAADIQPAPQYAPGELKYYPLVLRYAVPSEILKLMKWDKDMVDMNPFTPVQPPEVRPLLSYTQSNISQLSQAYGAPSVPLGGGNAGVGAANRTAEHRTADPNSTDEAHQFGFPPGGGSPFQRPGATPAIPDGLPAGVARIFALQSNNSLLVEATPEGYNQIKQIVKILDVAPRQVEIKVEFVTASVTDVDNLGINFDLVPYPGLEIGTQQGSTTIAQGIIPTFLQYATGNIAAQLYQTLIRTRGKVVQAPLITTTNNVTASITVATQIPFFTNTAVSNGNFGGSSQGSQANFLTLNTGLTITPRINADDSVTMNLTPQITDTTGQASVGGIPPTISQSINTLRTVRSGDTMVLGGLVRKQETASSERIPLLSDIPFLGQFFRTRNKQTNDQELLIFVTPTIIGESNDSATSNANGGGITVSP